MPSTRAPVAPEFRWPIRVYWEDTDAGGIVYYANYLKYFERARTEWLRSLGFEQERLRRELGAVFVVADAGVRYLRPARLDDCLEVGTCVVELRKASLQIGQQVWRGAELLVQGSIRLGCVDVASFKPRPLPAALCTSLG